MVKLDRYIGVTVFVAILAVLGVILGLALLLAFIDELNDISASYGIGDALRFIFLTAPRRGEEDEAQGIANAVAGADVVEFVDEGEQQRQAEDHPEHREDR
ncbi:hypothetical protein Q4R52_21585, partial [Morganella morganii]